MTDIAGWTVRLPVAVSLAHTDTGKGIHVTLSVNLAELTVATQEADNAPNLTDEEVEALEEVIRLVYDDDADVDRLEATFLIPYRDE